MPDFQITDNLDAQVGSVQVDLAHPSSLVEYLKTQVLHLAVFPDFLAHKDEPLSVAAAKPLQFQAKAQHAFQLGIEKPAISIKPELEAAIRVNASPGANLFEDNAFPANATVPPHTGYFSVAFGGALDAAVSASGGDLTFGIDAGATIGLEYWKAFPLGAGEPSLGEALGRTLSSYTIPARLEDLGPSQFGVNDIATASGSGSLTVSGAVKLPVAPNPLASLSLPLGLGAIAVKAGAIAGLSASFAISGAYQVRAVRKDVETIELSFLRGRGATLTAGIVASGGVTAGPGETDLISALLGAISTDPSKDQQRLADLDPSERKALAAVIKSSIDHNLQASLNAALARIAEDQAAFQYQIRPEQLDAAGRDALNAALRGNLGPIEAGAAGIRPLKSVFSESLATEATLKLNLLGIFNYITVSDLIRAGEVIADPVTGDLTIKDRTTGTVISAITEPVNRVEPLRKALFDSVVLTVTYIASRSVEMPGFACNHVHFALHTKAGKKEMDDYLNWFVALNLIDPEEKSAALARIPTGETSTCILRTAFGDAACLSLFFDADGGLWPAEHYLDYGRRAMRAILQPAYQPYDRYRYALLADDVWPQAVETGPAPDLAELVGISRTDLAINFLIGDVYAITQWASAMVEAGKQVLDMHRFLASAAPGSLEHNPEFDKRRRALQKKIASILGDSRMRFDDPWGMVSLFWSAGSPQPAYGKIARKDTVDLERGAVTTALAAGART
jgi:hypothetical protein